VTVLSELLTVTALHCITELLCRVTVNELSYCTVRLVLAPVSAAVLVPSATYTLLL